MKSKYWYYKGSDIIGTGKEEEEARALRAKKRAAKGEKGKKVVNAAIQKQTEIGDIGIRQ